MSIEPIDSVNDWESFDFARPLLGTVAEGDQDIEIMILHIDMDAFYASVEIRDQPALRGKPVVVGGTPEGRGVVAAASYEARKFGVFSAMPAARAKQLCPHAIFLPVRMDRYIDVSRRVFEIFNQYTPLVEPLSLDEAFLDATGSERLHGNSIEIARRIKDDILNQERLIASVGVAPNKFLAKLASDSDKPDGFVVVANDQVQSFLDPIPIKRMWGIGRVGAERCSQLRLATIGDLRLRTRDWLVDHFGSQGDHFYRLSRGIDDRRVIPDREAKSVSHETTFAEDIEDLELISASALELTEQVAIRLRRNQLQGRRVQLKIRYRDFETFTRSQTLEQPTNVTQQIWQAIELMIRTRLPKRFLSVRLIGVGVSGFHSNQARQRTLFEDEDVVAHSQLDQAADEIRKKFGHKAIGRGSRWLRESEDGTS